MVLKALSSGITPGGFRGAFGMLDIETRSARYKENTLPTVLLLRAPWGLSFLLSKIKAKSKVHRANSEFQQQVQQTKGYGPFPKVKSSINHTPCPGLISHILVRTTSKKPNRRI